MVFALPSTFPVMEAVLACEAQRALRFASRDLVDWKEPGQMAPDGLFRRVSQHAFGWFIPA